MWFIIVSILACFNIDKTKDEKGEYIEIDDEFEEFGLVRCVMQYIIRFDNFDAQKIDTKPNSNAPLQCDPLVPNSSF